MPNVRRLGYKDRFVWSLIQEIDGGSSDLPPVQFEPGVEQSLTVSFTQETWEEVFSALMTGADLSYPANAHQVVWNLLKHIEYPMPALSPAGYDSNLSLFARYATLNAGTYNYVAQNSTHPFGHSMTGTSQGVGQRISWTGFLAAGTYKCNVLYVRSSNAPKMCVRFLDVAVEHDISSTDIDMYGSFALNQVQGVSVVLPVSARWHIEIVTTGKNASSSDYIFQLTHLVLEKTA